MQKLPDIGAKIPDPKAMLSSPPQRMRRAGRLLAIGLALALAGDGWEPHLHPRVFQSQGVSEPWNPFLAVEGRMDGKLSREAWVRRCRELGISPLAWSQDGRSRLDW